MTDERLTEQTEESQEAIEGVLRDALVRMANSIEVDTPSIEDLLARSQARRDNRPSVRARKAVAVAGSRAFEACGFLHNPGNNYGMGGLRIGQPSYGEGGREYSALDRYGRRIATATAIGGAAYLVAKYGTPTL